ncbi:ABC transporter ATP-binding protein [Clostridia bacterium]|nr:ABC transporter ATP-binding protein [Clostridia bacterium]
MSTIVEVKNLKKYYSIKSADDRSHKSELKAVDDVNFLVNREEVFGIVGESGSGKTTIGKLLLDIEAPTSGEIVFEGGKTGKQMIFQNPYTSFNPALTLGRSLEEIGLVHKLGKEETGKRISLLLEQTALTEDVLKRKPKELSGGQLQRLAIARALLLRPEFLVADEPVSALDVSVQAQVINLFGELKEEYGLTILFISHDLTVVEYMCDRIAVVYLGRIVETARTEQIFRDTLHPYSQMLLASRPKAHPDDPDSEPLENETTNTVRIPDGCRFFPRCPKHISGLCDKIDPPEKEVFPDHFVSCHLYPKSPKAAPADADAAEAEDGTYVI